jgi:hypothetical protein
MRLCPMPGFPQMRMTRRDPMLEPFDALIGTWATEATHPLVDEVVLGYARFGSKESSCLAALGIAWWPA